MAEGSAEIVRDRVGEGFEFAVGGLAFDDEPSEVLVEFN